MEAYERLADVFDRGLKNGIDTLPPDERELFRIQDFIIEYEMGGLTSYFYNRICDMDGIHATVRAMRDRGMLELAGLLDEAADLFSGYKDSEFDSTWGEQLRRLDPTDRLHDLHKQIGSLSDFGLPGALID